uniref:Uncharacterized protein n=1 Tax=uncultured Muribaculaceae bacterium TaxID=2301481 RepID=A0A6G8F3H3_9BACT|nr:hypothetical protein Muribac1_0260 [uncultured Muribaculaceae bacterium]
MGLGVSAQDDCRSIVDNMLDKYPKSTMHDIYKSFFQDRFGPGHLVNDTTMARKYLHEELESMGETSLPYYEPVGKGENYYRVSLAVIRDGIITEDSFFDAFIESAGKVKFPAISEWKEEWTGILKVIPTDIDNYSADKAMIDSVLNAGKYVIHHSRRFETAYHPYYRLIDKGVFERRMLPEISAFLESGRDTKARAALLERIEKNRK